MYSSFTVKNFRCFKFVTIDQLDRVNLIAGKNNIGKTALLEALWWHSGPDLPDLGMRVDAIRGLPLDDPREFLWDLFWDFDPGLAIELIATGDWSGEPRRLTIRIRERETTRFVLSEEGKAREEPTGSLTAISPSELVLEYLDETGRTFTSRGRRFQQQTGLVLSEGMEKEQQKIPGRPTSIYIAARRPAVTKEDADRFGKMQVAGAEDQVVQTLRNVEPRIKRLLIIPIRDVPVVHADVGLRRLVPLPLLGDGVCRLLSLAVSFGLARRGIVVIDEAENGLHYTVMKKVWTSIADLARAYDVQVFATTHSEECVRSAHEAFIEGDQYDFALHRLERFDTEVRAVTFDRVSLATALEAGWEVR